MTKIIALLPFRNEERFLHTCVTSLCGIVDEIVAMDDFSTDKSMEVVSRTCHKKNTPLQLHEGIAEKKHLPVEKLRQRLLDLGRSSGGTHFICLDADEAFTANFIPNGRKIIERLEPGQKLTMQWLAMWKSQDHYRDDQSVWSKNFKDFIVCDDRKIEVDNVISHGGRTPGPNNEKTNLRLNPKYGAVFHFQFSDWNAFQIKQAKYRCFEKSIGRPDDAINQRYLITKDDPGAIVSAVPQNWLFLKEDMPDISYAVERPDWHLKEIEDFFVSLGVKTFEKLDIWHVPEIRQLRDRLV